MCLLNVKRNEGKSIFFYKNYEKEWMREKEEK